MPALPSVAKTLLCVIRFTHTGGGGGVVRFFIAYSGTAPTSGQLNTFCTALNTDVVTWLIPSIHSEWTYVGSEATDLSSPTAAQGSATASQAGTYAGTALPADAAFVASYEINRRYRGGHPRSYFPFGVAAAMTDAREWSAGSVTNFLAAVNGFYTAVIGNLWTGAGSLFHVSVSYYQSFTVYVNPITGRARNVPKPRTVPIVDTITTVLGRAQIGSQRRRLSA
jgi:hypothetical protein